MLHFSPYKIASIGLLCLVALIGSFPNFFSPKTVEGWPGWLPRRQISLGLDLRGGAHFLLGMNVDELRRDWLDGIRGDAWRRLREAKIGYTALTTQQLWVNHPEKAFGVRADWVDKHPKAALAVTKAVMEAQIWCDKPENRKEMCEIVSRRSWFNVPVDDIIGRTSGEVAFGS